MKYDVIVVGAGLGGLTAGARLAKEGKSVLLLEQHDRPGGCATTFNRKDFIMEVGLHEMDGLHPRDLKTKIFRDLGIFEKVEFLSVPEFYRFYNERHDIVIPHDPEEAQSRLLKAFPEEKTGIESYFYHALNARKIFSESVGRKDRNLGDFLDEIITNDDLKLVLLGNLGYFHDDPYTISLYYYLTAQGSYYAGRGTFIQGGSQKLSNAFSSIIQENNGTVKLNSLVTSIIPETDNHVSVHYQDCKGTDRESHMDQATEVIVNASVPGLAKELLPEKHSQLLLTEISNVEIGASLLTVYYGFSKPLKDLGNVNYSTFIYDESVKTQADIVINNHSDFDTRSFTFVDYSQIDSRLAPPGKAVGAVCSIDYLEDWESLSREEYLAKKKRVADQITSRCDKIIPGFRNAVEYIDVGTSLTVKRYTRNPGGAVYGFAQKPGKTSSYLDALPDNIHIASAWGKFGGGFSGSIYSGYMTAFDILRKR